MTPPDRVREARIGTRGGWCFDCGRLYGDEHGFPDLIVPHDVWNEHISPFKHEGGLLCPSCMAKRAADAGLVDIPAAFKSGPFRTSEDGITRNWMDRALKAEEALEVLRAEHAAEIAALRADGERLDWLEKMASQLPVEVDACTSVRDGKDYRVILTGIDLDDDEHPVEDLGQGRTLREAADAARAEGK